MSDNKHKLPDIVRATADFEKWASRHVHMVQSDVKLKHRNIAYSAFPFFPSTFYLSPHRWLRLVALNKPRAPVVFWEKIRNCPRYKGALPKDVLKLLHSSLPLRSMSYDLKSRVAGLGSLGHPRVLALADWHGAHIVREAKQLTPSAWIWAKGLHTAEILSRKLVSSAVRILDPHVHFADHWIVRRLAPDCCHIEIQTLPEERDEERLLYYMGWETANIHLGSPKTIPAVRRDLAPRKDRWLHKAAKTMPKVTMDNCKVWRAEAG